MGLFGLNFGASKTKSSTNSALTKDEKTTQNQSTDTTGTTNTNTSATGSTSSQGTATQTQTGATTNTATKATDTTGVSSLFGQGVQLGLEGLVTNLLGTAGTANPATAGLTFDSDKYVAGATDAARAKVQTTLDGTLGGIGDMVGAKLGNSSMGDLLAGRATADAASAVAGVNAQAQQTAAQITNANAATTLAGQKTQTDSLAQLLAVLKGGTQVTTQTGTESGTGATTSTGSSSTATSENSQSATQQTSAQTIQQLVNALLNGSTSTTGTESSKTKGSSLSASGSIGK